MDKDTNKKGLLDFMPKAKTLLESLKDNPKPTIEDRIEALELVMLEQLLEGLEDA
jgi:hypothetical protein